MVFIKATPPQHVVKITLKDFDKDGAFDAITVEMRNKGADSSNFRTYYSQNFEKMNLKVNSKLVGQHKDFKEDYDFLAKNIKGFKTPSDIFSDGYWYGSDGRICTYAK